MGKLLAHSVTFNALVLYRQLHSSVTASQFLINSHKVPERWSYPYSEEPDISPALVGTFSPRWENGGGRPNVWPEHGRNSSLSSLCKRFWQSKCTYDERRERRWGRGERKGVLGKPGMILSRFITITERPNLK